MKWIEANKVCRASKLMPWKMQTENASSIFRLDTKMPTLTKVIRSQMFWLWPKSELKVCHIFLKPLLLNHSFTLLKHWNRWHSGLSRARARNARYNSFFNLGVSPCTLFPPHCWLVEGAHCSLFVPDGWEANTAVLNMPWFSPPGQWAWAPSGARKETPRLKKPACYVFPAQIPEIPTDTASQKNKLLKTSGILEASEIYTPHHHHCYTLSKESGLN